MTALIKFSLYLYLALKKIIYHIGKNNLRKVADPWARKTQETIIILMYHFAKILIFDFFYLTTNGGQRRHKVGQHNSGGRSPVAVTSTAT